MWAQPIQKVNGVINFNHMMYKNLCLKHPDTEIVYLPNCKSFPAIGFLLGSRQEEGASQRPLCRWPSRDPHGAVICEASDIWWQLQSVISVCGRRCQTGCQAQCSIRWSSLPALFDRFWRRNLIKPRKVACAPHVWRSGWVAWCPHKKQCLVTLLVLMWLVFHGSKMTVFSLSSSMSTYFYEAQTKGVLHVTFGLE